MLTEVIYGNKYVPVMHLHYGNAIWLTNRKYLLITAKASQAFAKKTYLPNWDNIHGHRCERSNRTVKCKMYKV